MFTSKEINEYIHGRPRTIEKKQFGLNEAREIGNTLGVDWKRFDVEQFATGLNIELEHGRENPRTDVTSDEPITTGNIVLVHLNRIPDYYTRLAVMEKEAQRAKGVGDPADRGERTAKRKPLARPRH
jgi:hypothetical protein